MQGVISYIDTRKPTEIEMETARFYEVTADIPWDPYSDRFSEEEANFRVSSLRSKLCQKSSVVESMADPVKFEYLEFVARPRRLSSCSSRISAMIVDHLEGKDSGELPNKGSGEPIGRSSTRVSISPEILSKRWQISLKKAKQTIKATTQRGTRKHGDKLVRRLGTQRWRNKRVVPGRWYSDTIYFSVKSITRKEKSAQIFTNGKGFDIVYPIESVKQCHQALVNFIQEHGIPQVLVVDGHRSQASFDTYNTQWG